MRLSDIHQLNIEAVERERIQAVKRRAVCVFEGYLAAKACFKEIELKDGRVRHGLGWTEIQPWTGHVNSLKRIPSFTEREKGVFYHISAPVRIISNGIQAKVIIEW